MQFVRIQHQFNLFDYNEMRPRLKFSQEDKLYLRIKCHEGKLAMKNKDAQGTLEALEDIQERLENYSKRINQKPRK